MAARYAGVLACHEGRVVLVREALWFALDEAVEALSSLPYRPLADPAVAYLRGDAEAGRHWRFAL